MTDSIVHCGVLLLHPDLNLARRYYRWQRRSRLLAGFFICATLEAIPLCLRLSRSYEQQVTTALNQPLPLPDMVANLAGMGLLALAGALIGEIILFSALAVLFSQSGQIYQARGVIASQPGQSGDITRFYIYIAGQRLLLQQKEQAYSRLVLGQEPWLLLTLHQRHGRLQWQALGTPARYALSSDQLAKVGPTIQDWDDASVQEEMKRLKYHWGWQLCYWLLLVLLLALPIILDLMF